MINRKEVERVIGLFKKIDPNTLCTALLLYDVAGIDEPTQKQVENVAKVWDEVDSIYAEDVRYMVIDATNEENNEEEMG